MRQANLQTPERTLRAGENPTAVERVAPRQVPQISVARTFSGVIQKITKTEWTVGNRTVTIDTNTSIEGDPKVGQTAEVRVQTKSDGALLALHIKVLNRNSTPTNLKANQ